MFITGSLQYTIESSIWLHYANYEGQSSSIAVETAQLENSKNFGGAPLGIPDPELARLS